MDERLVLLGLDLHLEEMRGCSGARAGDDLHRLAGRQLTVHAGGGDADPLLAATHPQAMKFRAVEEFREDARDVLANNAGPVIRHSNAKLARLAGCDGFPVRHYLECD